MIVKVTAPNSVPTDISDYQAQNAHMMAFMNQVNMQAFILTNPTVLSKPKVAQGTYISHGGSLYKVDSTDEDIAGSPSDGKVYIRVTGDATLTASFITDISGYTYNHAYGALTNGNYTLLPYELRKSGSNWVKYRYDAVQKLQAETLNTGQGDNLLYPMDQGVKTTDSPTFAQITTTNGPNKPVDNNDASMPSVGIGGFSYAVGSTSTSGAYPSITIGSGGTWVYVAQSGNSNSPTSTITKIGRVAGGTSVQGSYSATSSITASVHVIAWRIA
jgi:hypothetical protein